MKAALAVGRLISLGLCCSTATGRLRQPCRPATLRGRDLPFIRHKAGVDSFAVVRLGDRAAIKVLLSDRLAITWRCTSIPLFPTTRGQVGSGSTELWF